MGVVLGTYGATDATGWTVVTESALGAGEGSAYVGNGTRKIYVATSPTGNDSNPGTQAAPVATLAHAASLTRAGKPDWVLLRRGEIWTESFGNWPNAAGQDADNPLLVSSYGTGARPLIRTATTQNGFGTSGAGSPVYLAVIGLDFLSYQRDPNNNANLLIDAENPRGASTGAAAQFILIEDCRFQFYSAIVLDCTQEGGHGHVYFRRNVVAYNWSWNAHGQGMHSYQIMNSFTVEENFFIHNGWLDAVPFSASITQASPAVVSVPGTKLINGNTVKFQQNGGGITAGTAYYIVSRGADGADKFRLSLTDGGAAINTTAGLISPQNMTWQGTASPDATIFNHNVYLDRDGCPTVFRGNVSAQASLLGAQLRPGGTITDNLFFENGIGFNFFGYGSVVTNNVVLQGQLHVNAESNGITITGGADGSTTTNNIIAHSEETATQYAIQIAPSGNQDCTLTIADPAVMTQTEDNYGLFNGARVRFVNNGDTLPAAFAFGTDYYCINTGDIVLGITRHNYKCNLAAAPNGVPINTGGQSQSGTHRFFIQTVGAIANNNIIYDWDPNVIDDQGINTIATPNAIDGSNESYGVLPYPDANRTVSTYNASVRGGALSTDAFLADALEQSRDNWDVSLTATAVNTYIRAGFGIGIEPPPDETRPPSTGKPDHPHGGPPGQSGRPPNKPPKTGRPTSGA